MAVPAAAGAAAVAASGLGSVRTGFWVTPGPFVCTGHEKKHTCTQTCINARADINAHTHTPET